MKDVSHTPPHGVSADAVWERGGENEPTPEADADAADRTPADD